MHKALAIAAIATLAMGSEDLAAENELNFFKSVGNGLKKAGTFVIQHPKIITTAAKILAVDDEELFSLHNAIHKAEEGVKKAEKKAVDYVAQHPEVVREAIEILKNLKHDDEELFHLGKTLHNVAHAVGKVEHVAKDGLNVVKNVQSGNYIGAIQSGIQTVKDVKHDDEELFNIHNVVHKAEEGVKKAEHYVYDHRHQIENGAKKAVNYVAEHPEVVKQAIEILKNLKQHDDEELFHLGKTIHNVAHAVGKVEHVAKDAAQVVKNVQTGNYIGAVQSGIKTVKDVKHDDEELFHLGKVVHNVAHAVGKVEHVAKDAVQVVKDVQTGNYVGAVQHGIQTVKDAKKHDDEELFHLGKVVKNVAHTVGKVEHVAKDGLNVVKNVQSGNYIGAIQSGIQTVKDVKHDDEELFHLGKVVHNVAHAVGKVEHVAKDAAQVVKNVQTGNYIGAIQSGIKTVKDVKHDDEELFNIHNAIHKVEEGVKKAEHKVEDGAKKAGHYVYEHRQQIADGAKKAINYAHEHPEVVKEAVEILKKLRHHDDEELFNLGNLINDGLNIYGDIKSKNYGGLVNDSIKTVKDIKKHDDEELFHLGKVVHNVAHAVGKVEHVAKDAASVVKNVQTGNYIGAIQSGIKTVKDVKHDDEELFHLGKVVHNVAHAVGKVEHVAKDGLNVVKNVQSGNYIGAIQSGIQTVKDVKHDDEELFNLGTLINDGLNIAKDVKAKNYGNLVNDSIQTVKDVKQAAHGKKFLRH